MNTMSNRFLASALFDGRTDQPMTELELRTYAPSIFATEAHESRSERFTYLPTIDAVRALQTKGFYPVAAKQGRSRTEGKAEFTKHLVRFRHENAVAMRGSAEVMPEIIIQNAHDGTSAWKVLAGGFRPICRNGLIAIDSLIADVRVVHTGNVIDKVIDGTWTVVEEVHKIVEVADRWLKIDLTPLQQRYLSEAVHEVRFDGVSDATREAITPPRPLTPRRAADANPSLWHVTNRLQENCLNGGLEGIATVTDPETNQRRQRRVTTRPVRSVEGDTALNRAIWSLATKMEELLG